MLSLIEAKPLLQTFFDTVLHEYVDQDPAFEDNMFGFIQALSNTKKQTLSADLNIIGSMHALQRDLLLDDMSFSWDISNDIDVFFRTMADIVAVFNQ